MSVGSSGGFSCNRSMEDVQKTRNIVSIIYNLLEVTKDYFEQSKKRHRVVGGISHCMSLVNYS